MATRISRYEANIYGSDAYFRTRRKELQSVIEQKGPATVWFTLSYADHHWQDMLRLLGDPPPGVDPDKWYFEQSKLNPSLFNEFFTKRVELFVQHFFGANGLDSAWIWFRYEWQMRGAIHVHGMVRLKSDPDLVALSKLAVIGRKSERFLAALQDIAAGSTVHLDAFAVKYPDDVYILPKSELLDKAELESRLDEEQRIALQGREQAKVAAGLQAVKSMVTYRDFLLTSINSSTILPEDCDKDKRTPHAPDRNAPHPSSVIHGPSNGPHSVPDDILYSDLCNATMRHRCYDTYCIRDGCCRFHFPRSINSHTRVKIHEKKYSSNHTTKAGLLRKVSVDVVPATNDRWFNGHCRPAIMAWGGNCDFSILVDLDAQLNYIAKYGTKKEGNSKCFEYLFTGALRKAREDEASGNRVVRRIFTQQTGGREKTHQEIAHISLGITMVKCTEHPVHVNLYNNRRLIRVPQPAVVGHVQHPPDDPIPPATPEPDANNAGAVLKCTLMDFYAKRLDRSLWHRNLHQFFDSNRAARQHPQPYSILDMTFLHFAQQYKLVARGGDFCIAANTQSTIVIFTPDFHSNRDSANYPQYCFFNLLKYKSWVDFAEQVYGGQQNTFSVDNIIADVNMHDSIIQSWEAFMVQNLDNPAPFHIQQQIDKLRGREEGEQWTQYDDMPDELELDDTVRENDFVDICRAALLLPDQLMNPDECEWDRDFDWPQRNETYNVDIGSLQSVKLLWDTVAAANALQPPPDRRIILPEQLRDKQRVAFRVACHLLDTVDDPCRMMLLIGEAGCGKSFVIDALIHKYQQQLIIMAPSGKAASNIGGSTIHSALRIPVKASKYDGEIDSCAPLTGEILMSLQTKFQDVKGILIDEFTMINQTMLSSINSRCKQLKSCADKPFGGLFVLLAGDPGQLPPVSGRPLWYTKPATTAQKDGFWLYNHFFKTNVVRLVGSNRLDPLAPMKEELLQFFSSLRTGEVTQQQWEWLNEHTSEHHHLAAMGAEEFRKQFNSYDSTYYYNTNLEITQHNHRMLAQNRAVGHHVCKIDALHNCDQARKGGDDKADCLPIVFYVSVKSKVMLTYNIDTSTGLVNGATGVVCDIVFAPNERPSSTTQPVTVVVDIPTYTGTAFFQDHVDPISGSTVSRKTWVPLQRKTIEWYAKNKVTMQRTAFPLSLAWAWTPWKGQGTTNRGPCVMHPGATEKSDGLCYVMLTRVTRLSDLHIPGGVSFDRVTIKIRKHPGQALRVAEEKKLDRCSEATVRKFAQFDNL